jgi:hypothetical protein
MQMGRSAESVSALQVSFAHDKLSFGVVINTSRSSVSVRGARAAASMTEKVLHLCMELFRAFIE